MSIKLNKDLWAKVKKVAMAAGYSSPEEFVEHVLEREIAKLEDAQTDQEIVAQAQRARLYRLMLSAAHCLSLTAIAIAYGLAALWVFARFSDQKRIEIAKRKLRAHLYAFRLFVDEPALIFRAQKQLLIWNGRYLALVLVPAIIIGIPTLVLLMQLEAVYGRRPLAAGESAIVTAHFDNATDLRLISPMLEGRGVEVETPPVRIPLEHQVSWRVRAASDASGSVLLGVQNRQQNRSSWPGSEIHFPAARGFCHRLAALSRGGPLARRRRPVDRGLLSGCQHALAAMVFDRLPDHHAGISQAFRRDVLKSGRLQNTVFPSIPAPGPAPNNPRIVTVRSFNVG